MPPSAAATRARDRASPARVARWWRSSSTRCSTSAGVLVGHECGRDERVSSPASPSRRNGRVIRDLTDEQARAALPLKWGDTAPGVVPAWVAEMDFRLAEPIEEALVRTIRSGGLGYPPFTDGIGTAFAGFAQRHWSWPVPADASVATGGVDGRHPDRARDALPAGPRRRAAAVLPAVPPRRRDHRARAAHRRPRPGRRQRDPGPRRDRARVHRRRPHVPALQPAQPARPRVDPARARGARRARQAVRRPRRSPTRSTGR